MANRRMLVNCLPEVRERSMHRILSNAGERGCGWYGAHAMCDWLAEHTAQIELFYLPAYSPGPLGQCPDAD
jgi:hypothetical protein